MHVPDLNTNPYYLTWANDLISENITANGTIVTLTFEVPEGTEEGKYAVNVSYDKDNAEIIDKDFNDIEFFISSGEVEVINFYSGDANGDGQVNTADRMLLARSVARWGGYSEQIADTRSVDFNKDGKVNAADRMIISRYLAKWAGYSQYFE